MGPAPVLQSRTCGHSNPGGSHRCANCQSAISLEDVTQTNIGWSRVVSGPESQLHTFATGTLLSGRYEILQTLGQGCMGTVYKARDRELDRQVAVKVIRADLANDGKNLARFKLPSRLEVRDDLPRTASGKVQKAPLRDEIRAQTPV